MIKPLESFTGIELDNFASWHGLKRRAMLFNLGESDENFRERIRRDQKARWSAKISVKPLSVWDRL